MTATASPTILRPKPARPATEPASQLARAAGQTADELLGSLGSSAGGLAEAEAAKRLAEFGPNEVAAQAPIGWPRRLLRAIRNPLVVLLSVLAAVSAATGDMPSAGIMLVMVLIGIGVRLTQEWRADTAAEQLRAMIRVTAAVVRDGRAREVDIKQLVPGDVVKLSAGDLIPADVRLIAAKDLFIAQSTLTGESVPVEKFAAPQDRPDADLLQLPNVCFMGTSVQSGSATAVVLTTGTRTYFGNVAGGVTAEPPPTSFDRGINSFTWLMIGFMAFMVPLVFVINGLTEHRWMEAFFFALSVAVGLTPEMLPTIVSVCLSKGAMAMSRQRVIVKRLKAIQNLGAMDVLCTDKTGTLTLDRVVLERYCDVAGNRSDGVLRDAYLISHFQTGLKSVMDQAVLDHCDRHPEWGVDDYQKLDEIPFDFSRRIMSVVVRPPAGGPVLLAKGAPEHVLPRCSRFELDGEVDPIDAAVVHDVQEEYELLSRDGFRVLAVAYRDVDPKPAYGHDDERDLVLCGYIAFLDPPKETAAAAIRAIGAHGVQVKVLSGDHELVCRKVSARSGSPPAGSCWECKSSR